VHNLVFITYADVLLFFNSRVFNTVTRSLGCHLNPAVSPAVSWTFLTDCFAKMLRTVVKALDICMDEDLIVTGMHEHAVNQARSI
jgi:hypothetical protein